MTSLLYNVFVVEEYTQYSMDRLYQEWLARALKVGMNVGWQREPTYR
jgi:hypothetical protein